MYCFVDESTLYIGCIPDKKGKSTKGVVGLGENVLRVVVKLNLIKEQDSF
jgi:hypothetical protein